MGPRNNMSARLDIGEGDQGYKEVDDNRGCDNPFR